MSVERAPGWTRGLEVVFGLVGVVAAGVVMAYPGLAILTLILFLSVALLFVGAARVVVGISGRKASGGLRGVNVGAGILAVVLAIVALVYPGLATQVLIYLLSLGLLFHGLARVGVAAAFGSYPAWFRGLLAAVGLLSIVLSVAVFLFPGVGYAALVVMLSVGFLFNGVARLIRGVTGYFVI